jgi:outer membrane protein OmpA-like peptidoglycan-associated protein
MNRIRPIGFLLAIALFTAFVSLIIAFPQGAEPDASGCKDHPLFTRMQNMRLTWCKTTGFDLFTFKGEKGKDIEIEGKRFEIRYATQEGFDAPSPLAILRNHQQAIKNIGGTVLYEDERYTTLMVAKDGKEIWAQVDTAWGRGYMLFIVEKQAMVQEVVANAEIFKTGLNASGHVEVPGIFFDTGKSVLKPESDAAVAEIAKLLKADPGLKVFVVGHTDNVASLDLNMKLSQARSEAVVQALIAKHGIAGERLIGRGVGPLAPVASNDTEDGRAKNRRVELVKQ